MELAYGQGGASCLKGFRSLKPNPGQERPMNSGDPRTKFSVIAGAIGIRSNGWRCGLGKAPAACP